MMPVRDEPADHHVDRWMMTPACHTYTGVIQP